MLNCKQASQLASRAMDEKLSFWENMSLKLHLFLCRACTQFTQQLVFLRKVSRHSQINSVSELSEAAKQRILQSLEDKPTP
tara:strand:- start:1046 stop:1288 length:243 start_codon:yes stop_codon:yes gene_type:complete